MSERYAEALAAANDGDAERVVALAREAIPGLERDEDRYAWTLLLAEAGAVEHALALVAQVMDPSLAGALRRLLDADDDEPLAADDEDEPIELQRTPTEDLALSSARDFLRWFGGRRDLYACQWHDERRGRSGYRPVREPLTEAVARGHLGGRTTVGQYLLWPDASVSFAVVDLDLSRSALATLRAGWGDDVSPLQSPAMREHVERLMGAARRLGLSVVAEDSGGRGAHLWLFFEPRIGARAARAVLGQLVVAAGPAPADVRVEIFPKQGAAGPRGLSSLVKLPLGLHRVSLRRCALLDDGLQPIADVADALGRLRTCDPAVVDAIAGRRVLALPAPELTPAGEAPPIPSDGTPRALAEALRATRSEREAAERMLDGCQVLRVLVNKAYTGAGLSANEARAVAYSLGLVGGEAECARDALVAAGVSLKELHRARAGSSAPVGCRRLLRLGVATCDGCPSGERAVPYATPALHALSPLKPVPAPHAPFAPWLEAGEAVVESPLDGFGRTLARIDGRLEQLERHLARVGEEAAPEPHASPGCEDDGG